MPVPPVMSEPIVITMRKKAFPIGRQVAGSGASAFCMPEESRGDGVCCAAKREERLSLFARQNATDSPARLCYGPHANRLHTGVECMDKLVEIRRQEYLCRERALRDSERKVFWLAEAEEWEQRALDEIAFHFRECNLESPSHSLSAHSLSAA
jgi:hypothetical protein